eukprot:248025-Rhodomonas_salina.2
MAQAVSSNSLNQTSEGFLSGDPIISPSSEALCTNTSSSSHVGSSSEQFGPGQASLMQRFNTSPSAEAASMTLEQHLCCLDLATTLPD